MDLSKLNEYTKQILVKSGWSEEHSFDCTKWVNALTDEGYQIHAYALEILEELGDIYVYEKTTSGHNAATFNFNPFNSASGEFDRISEFQRNSGDGLFPIGECFEDILYAGESKKIYGGSWAGLHLLGNDIEEFLNNMFSVDFKPVDIGPEQK